MLTPIKAIRKKCLSCSCGHVAEVRDCPVKNCALYPYRMGKRPKREPGTVASPDAEDVQESTMVLTEE